MDDQKVTITAAGKTVETDLKTWIAFLEAGFWTIDSGDFYLLLRDKYDHDTLDKVGDLKEQLNDPYLSSLK